MMDIRLHMAPELLRRLPYAAYGSNLLHAQMVRRCGNDLRFLGTGFIKGFRLAFAKYATIVEDSEAQVPVGLWILNEKQLQLLDRYEGYPRSYERQLMMVKREKGQDNFCFTYIKTDNDDKRPPDEYVRRIAGGYDDCGLDKAYLSAALEPYPSHEEQGAGLMRMMIRNGKKVPVASRNDRGRFTKGDR